MCWLKELNAGCVDEEKAKVAESFGKLTVYINLSYVCF